MSASVPIDRTRTHVHTHALVCCSSASTSTEPVLQQRSARMCTQTPIDRTRVTTHMHSPSPHPSTQPRSPSSWPVCVRVCAGRSERERERRELGASRAFSSTQRAAALTQHACTALVRVHAGCVSVLCQSQAGRLPHAPWQLICWSTGRGWQDPGRWPR